MHGVIPSLIMDHFSIVVCCLILYSECWAVFRFRLAAVVQPGRADVGMTKPLLNLGDVRFVFQGIGGRDAAHRMYA